LRILHLSSLYPPHVVGGCEISVSHLCEELVAMGNTVGAACIEREAERVSVRNGVSIYRMQHYNDFWLEDWSNYNRSQRRMQKLKQQWNFKIAADFGRVLDDFKPDILNTHSLLDISTLVWREAAVRNIPILHTICEYDLICGNAALFKNGRNCQHVHMGCRIVNFTKKINQKYLSGVASVGSTILATHQKHGYFNHLPENMRRVIYYSCEVPGADKLENITRKRRDGPFVFGYIGRINIEKGVGTIIDAFSKLEPGNWKCIVAGRALDDSVEGFKRKAGTLPIDFVGWVDPREFFNNIDVLICPSIWAEPSPRTIYESYNMGVPVIGSRSGGIPELIGESNSEWLFDAGNEDQLLDRLRWVLKQNRSELPDRDSFSTVINASDSRTVAENYIKFYKDILGSKSLF